MDWRIAAVIRFALVSPSCTPRPAFGFHPGALELYPPVVSTVNAFVDNFDMTNNKTFEQRVLTYSKWWAKGGPVFLYMGGEGSIEGFYNYTGAIFEHAQALEAMVVFLEHRYYGGSQPKGRSPKNADLRYLTVEQAMADFAWFLRGLKMRLGCGTQQCPVVTFGGSYGGMLVAWFRQRYPQLTAGGIAAGAPVDFYPGDGKQAMFWNATLHTFSKFGLPGCAESLMTALRSVQIKAASSRGRALLTKRLKSCDNLQEETSAGSKLDMFLRGTASSLAMLDYPEASDFVTRLPANPVLQACHRFQDAEGGDVLDRLKAVVDMYLNGTAAFRCYDFMAETVGRPTQGDLRGPVTPPDMGPWQYQACNELILETLTTDGYGFYPAADEQLDQVSKSCLLRYGVHPRPSWLPMSLGGSDLRIGRLLFTDGEKDPWRTGAVRLDRVMPGVDITHYTIPSAAHHEDLRFSSHPSRPEVEKAKRLVRAAIRRWISTETKASPELRLSELPSATVQALTILT